MQNHSEAKKAVTPVVDVGDCPSAYPMPEEPKDFYVEVTTTQLYYFDKSYSNGWSPDEVIDRWFNKYDLNSYHAARDSAALGGSKKLVSVRRISEEELKTQAPKVIK